MAAGGGHNAGNGSTLARQLSLSLEQTKGALAGPGLSSLSSMDLANFLQQLSKQNSLPINVGSLDFADFINRLQDDPEERERIARQAAIATTSAPAHPIPPPLVLDASVSELVNNHAGKTVDEVWQAIQNQSANQSHMHVAGTDALVPGPFVDVNGLAVEPVLSGADGTTPVEGQQQRRPPAKRGRKRKDAPPEDEAVIQERLSERAARNRESAARSRQRKETYTAQLEQEVQALKNENHKLKERIVVAEILPQAAAQPPPPSWTRGGTLRQLRKARTCEAF